MAADVNSLRIDIRQLFDVFDGGDEIIDFAIEQFDPTGVLVFAAP